MTNAKKYPSTSDALAAWDAYHDGGGGRPFADWLEQKYVEPRELTLLEAAEKAVESLRNPNSVDETIIGCVKAIDVRELEKAIMREKQKPVRNCDRFATAKEADHAYNEFCRRIGSSCKNCSLPITDASVSCEFVWLYAEAEKEAGQ